MLEDTIARINALAKKAKQTGLTPEEVRERDALRQEYLAAFRRSLVTELEHTYVVDEHGVKRPLKKKE